MFDYKGLKDEGLFELIRVNSDERAYNELYSRYHLKLHRFLVKYLDDADAADDILQDIFLHLWVKRDAVKIRAGISKYFFRAALNQIRIVGRREKVIARFEKEFEHSFNEGVETTESVIAVKEIKKAMDRGLELMKPKMRLVYTTSREKDMGYQEISDHLKIPKNTVKDKMKGAIRILRQIAELKINIFL